MPSFASYEAGDEPIAGYRLVDLLGRGLFGEVWIADDVAAGRVVALKIINLRFSGGSVADFRVLARMTALAHPNIVPVYTVRLRDKAGRELDLDQAEMARRRGELRELVVVMGLGEKSLASRLMEVNPDGTHPDDRQGLPIEELIRYMEGAAKGIDYLNQPDHGAPLGDGPIFHCDINPRNLLIVAGETQIADVGLAALLAPDARRTMAAGTPAYCSPEMAANQPGPGTDQYSLAVSYYELRTGRLPFDDGMGHTSIVMAHAEGRLNFSSPDLTEAEREVLKRATSLHPSDRFSTASTFVREAARAIEKLFPERTVRTLRDTQGVPYPSPLRPDSYWRTVLHPTSEPPDAEEDQPPQADEHEEPPAGVAPQASAEPSGEPLPEVAAESAHPDSVAESPNPEAAAEVEPAVGDEELAIDAEAGGGAGEPRVPSTADVSAVPAAGSDPDRAADPAGSTPTSPTLDIRAHPTVTNAPPEGPAKTQPSEPIPAFRLAVPSVRATPILLPLDDEGPAGKILRPTDTPITPLRRGPLIPVRPPTPEAEAPKPGAEDPAAAKQTVRSFPPPVDPATVTQPARPQTLAPAEPPPPPKPAPAVRQTWSAPPVEVPPPPPPAAVEPPEWFKEAQAEESQIKAPARSKQYGSPRPPRHITVGGQKAAVRYFGRMVPHRVFPLAVSVPADEMLEDVEIEPILPGCDCYPPRAVAVAEAGSESAEATFWVAPHVRGRVRGARVVVRRKGRVLAELALDIRVASRRWAWACAAGGLVVPYALMALRAVNFGAAGDVPLYRPAAEWVLTHLRPEWAGLGLFAAAAGLFAYLWPRQRETVWGVK